MSRICELTGKKRMVGNMVSHSNRKTKRSFHPNLVKKTVFYEKGGIYVTLKMCTSAWRSMAKRGVSHVINQALKRGLLAE